MNDTITLRGFVASDVRSSTTTHGTSTASFRLGTTERRYDRASNSWVDGHTNWYTIQAFRYLAGHVGCSIKKGQRVMVTGRLRLRQWEHEGRIYHVAEVDAESVGHDLMWGSANFTRMNGAAGPAQGTPSETPSGAASDQPREDVPWDAENPDGAAPDDQHTGGSSLPLEDESTGNMDPDDVPAGLMLDTTTGELVDAMG